MKCNNCQEPIEEKHRRCPNCGAQNPQFKDTAAADRERLEKENKELREENEKLKAKKKTDSEVL